MKRWIAFVAVLYPRSWREEFGDEFAAVLNDVKPSWRVLTNVLGGALSMQITEGTNWLKVVAATAALCALVAGGLSYRVAPNYVSSAVISVTPQADPVRPTPPEVLHERAAAHMVEMGNGILSRWSLATIINDPGLQLYREQLRRRPLEDVIEEMRGNIHIQASQSADGGMAPIVISISFSYPDQVKAQATVRALAGRFIEENSNVNRERTAAYRGFWQDMSAFAHTKPAPPPPVGEIVGVLNTANLPTDSVGPNRLVFVARGLGVGLVLGLLAAVGMRRPRGVWQLGGFAVAGFAVACALSYLIPNRFTSNGVMTLSPAILTEDPLTPLPAATPAAEYLRQTEPEILSFQTLSRIIQYRRLNLYSSERATKPMEEVVRNMLANDLRIVPLEPTSEAKGAVAAFRISFSYYDRGKAQETVNALMNAFEEQWQKQAYAKAPQMSVALHQIYQRKGGEVLEVVDPASLPVAPVAPNRALISVAGMGIGLLIGVVRIWRWRPGAAVLQPA
jgi:capsular polysaccharide biosynthesis protein